MKRKPRPIPLLLLRTPFCRYPLRYPLDTLLKILDVKARIESLGFSERWSPMMIGLGMKEF